MGIKANSRGRPQKVVNPSDIDTRANEGLLNLYMANNRDFTEEGSNFSDLCGPKRAQKGMCVVGEDDRTTEDNGLTLGPRFRVGKCAHLFE